MQSEQVIKLPDVIVWHAQYLRMIAFPVEPQLKAEQNWWRDVAGYESESVSRKPQKREESGVFDGCGLSLVIDPFRIRWTVSPHFDPETLPDQIPTLGPLTGRRDWFRGLTLNWLAGAPPIKRLAFAGSLLQFVDSKEDGYGILDGYLSHVEVDPSASDFMYRINRPIASKTGVDGLSINRLCTWACATFTMGIRASAGPSGEVRDIPLNEDRNACLLEFDINTVPNASGNELPRDRVGDIFSELMDSCFEIAARGDF